MFIHSDDGHHFLGCRKSYFGKVQMVYDFEGTRRKVYDLETQDVPVALLNSAIKKVSIAELKGTRSRRNTGPLSYRLSCALARVLVI